MPVGLFHTKDLLTDRTPFPLAGELRPLLFVPESKNVAGLLADMRGGAGHLAAVVDEHGDFAGIVTLADCLQALIGKVGDPGTGRAGTRAVSDRRWIVDGGLDLRQFHEETDLALPPSRDYVTVAGFVMARLGRIPAEGDQVGFGDATITVLEMAGHRVLGLQVDRAEPEEAS